jgi:O-antigen/teichoic acid export membrane protein
MALISPWLVTNVLAVPDAIQNETLHSFYWLAVSIPLVIAMAGLRGMLQAKQRFDLVNAVGIPMGVFSFLAPLAVLPFSSDLSHIVIILVIGKAIALVAHLLLCRQLFPGFLKRFGLDKSSMRPLFSFGGWITASNILGPLTLYADRFLIGSIVSVAAVAYYTTPYEIITKVLVISGALAGVIFPAFSTSLVQNSEGAARIFYGGIKFLFFILFPITLMAVLFAREALWLWLGAEFSENSFRSLQILAIGVLFLGIESVPWVFLQGAGRPDIPTKLNLVELPFYLATLWWLTHAYGITGTALAWSLRAGIDALALLVLAYRLLPSKPQDVLKAAVVVALIVASLGFAMFTFPMATKIEFLSFMMLVHLGVFWVFLLSQNERAFLREKIHLK